MINLKKKQVDGRTALCVLCHIHNARKRTLLKCRIGRLSLANNMISIINIIHIHICFVDFQQSYDSINRDKLWRALEEFKIPMKLIKLVKDCYTDTAWKVKYRNQLYWKAFKR